MSDFDGWWRYPRAARRPPPKHGIKVKKPGTTWWGKLWIEALERVSVGYEKRLARGKTYARAGRTHDLTVKPGLVTAKVTGSRSTPYEVRITLAEIDETGWRQAIESMARQAQFAADLLGGRMPENIDDAFRAAGTSLFPAREADFATSCSCPDWANPCKHVAATHYVLGEAFDRDPFLLFELRGRTKTAVLDALRAARLAAREPAEISDRSRLRSPPFGRTDRPAITTGSEPVVPGVTLGKITRTDYDRPREPLPALNLSLAAPKTSGALLAQLGAPASWSTDASPADLLAPLVQAASQRAIRVAMAERDETRRPELEPKESTPRRKGRKRKLTAKSPKAPRE